MQHAIAAEDLLALHNMEAGNARLRRCIHDAASDLPSLLRFLFRYTTWNGLFGAGVATLAGKIARRRDLFRDPEEPLSVAADRSVFVASFFFDAARDEFDDRVTKHRDTHRCLAQATLKALVLLGRERGELHDLDALESLFEEPVWLTAVCDRVAVGYGWGTSERPAALFRSMGYHLGSEVLADEEFTVLDRELRRLQPALVGRLEGMRVEVAGQEHRAWHWVRVHSGAGGGAEAAHFEWAVRGVRAAFETLHPSLRSAARHQVLLGFQDFCADHDEFFERVGEP